MRDSDVRAAVRHLLGELHAGDDDTRIVEEMGIWSGSARIDVATINGELSGFELKSDSDTLRRLPQQIDLYGRVFDRLTLVVGRRHSDAALALLPSWWGITIVREQRDVLVLDSIREPSPNPDREAYFVAQLLWREEALAVLDAHDLARGWKSKPARALHERLASALPMPVLSEHVRNILKHRAGWLGQPVGDER